MMFQVEFAASQRQVKYMLRDFKVAFDWFPNLQTSTHGHPDGTLRWRRPGALATHKPWNGTGHEPPLNPKSTSPLPPPGRNNAGMDGMDGDGWELIGN